MDIWQCPHCKEELYLFERHATCDNKHHYDRTKHGHFNFLLAHHKKSKAPGDSKAMIQARKAFLNKGHYAPLASSIADSIHDFSQKTHVKTLLDIGCGEAYYTQYLHRALNNNAFSIAGIDISKESIIQASKRHIPQSQLAVASSRELPILTQSVDLILCIFAPFTAPEIKRVLKNKGVFIRVSPGPKHLWELKQAIYQDPKEHTSPKDIEGFEKIQARRLEKTITLNNAEELEQLQMMTPFAWTAKKTLNITSKENIRIQCDFLIEMWSPN